jgi:hypothetical protein
MAAKDKSNLLAWVSATVAIGSLLLNAFQFYSASVERERVYSEEKAKSGPVAFYAYCDDQTLARLYAAAIGLATEPWMSAVTVQHGSPADTQIQTWLAQSRPPLTNLRSKPTASFLVVGNRQDFDLHDIRALVQHGQGVADTVLLKTPVLPPKTYLLVPLDFRAPGNDSSEPDTPLKVLVEYGAKPDFLSVTPTDPIDWLGTQFRRGLVRSAVETSSTPH